MAERGRTRYGAESDKKFPHSETEACRDTLGKFCIGKGADLGCGNCKINDTAIGIDLHRHPTMGVDDTVGDIRNLSMFDDEELDYIFASHSLEDLPDPEAALKEWVRVIKPYGFLVLYMPDKEYYWHAGHPLANHMHKKDYCIDNTIEMCKRIGGLSVEYADRSGPVYETGKWSFSLVMQKAIR